MVQLHFDDINATWNSFWQSSHGLAARLESPIDPLLLQSHRSTSIYNHLRLFRKCLVFLPCRSGRWQRRSSKILASCRRRIGRINLLSMDLKDARLPLRPSHACLAPFLLGERFLPHSRHHCVQGDILHPVVLWYRHRHLIVHNDNRAGISRRQHDSRVKVRGR